MKDKHFYALLLVLAILTLIDIFVKISVTITRPVVVRPCVGVTMEQINQAIKDGALEVVK